MCQAMQYLSFLLSKILSKRMMNSKGFFAKPWPFNCEKSIAIVIYGKCLVQEFGFTFVSLNCLPLQKFFFHEILLNLVEKKKKNRMF
jgi:hypothetical protein